MLMFPKSLVREIRLTAWLAVVISALVVSTSAQQSDESFSAGMQALQRGENAQAESYFRKALLSSPSSIPFLNNLAIAVGRQQRPEESISIYKHILEIAPDDAMTRRNLGVAYFRAQHYDLALPLLDEFAKKDPSFQALDLTGLTLFALGRYQDAAATLNRASEIEPRDLSTLDTLGKAYLRTKNYQGVNEVFKRVMAVDPESAEAHSLMGVADDNLFKEDDALKEFRAALMANPLYPGAHTSMGVIYWRNDNLGDAEREFLRELELYPNDPIANCTLGRIRQRQGRYDEALPFLEAAISANPSYADALIALGETRLSLNQPEGAVIPLQHVIELDGKNSEAHFLLGTALVKLGRSSEGAHERQIAGRLRAAESEQNRPK